MNLLDLFENISAQQRRVGQLPADFQPPKTSPQLSGPYPGKNATRGYLVGEAEEHPAYRNLHAIQKAATQGGDAEIYFAGSDEPTRIEYPLARHLASKYREMARSNSRDAAQFIASLLDARRFDLLTKQYRDIVDRARRMGQGIREQKSAATEDVLSTMKKKLGDYLQDVATAIKKDPDLVDKVDQAVDQLGAPVKTIRTDDGHEIKIHGNEDDGFRISIRNRNLPSKFRSLDEAEIASEMYCARRRQQAMEADYIDEKQDACYHKVKSRYKVWPSAYASGALVQCRKKGAKNWGTGGK